MKQCLFAALIAFLPFLASAQMMPDSTVQVCAYWHKGDRAVYECKSTTVKIERDGTETTSNAASETRIFEVIDETEKSYILQTSYKDVFSSDLSLSVGAAVLSQVAEGIVIQTQTNEFGTVQDIVNLEELTESMKRTIPLSVDAALAKHDKNTLKELGLTRQGLIDTYTDLFCRPETIVTACLDDVVPLLLYHGARLRLDQEYSVKQELNSPLPNTTGKLPIDLHFWVDEEQSDSSFVLIRSYFKVDSDALMPFLRESVLAATKTVLPEDLPLDEMEKEIDKGIAESHMQATMEQFTATEVHLGSGWTTQWWSKRRTTITTDEGETQTVEEKEVTIVDE